MKLSSLFSLVGICAIAVVCVQAEEPTTPVKTSAAPSKPTPRQVMTLKGAITSLDAAAGTLAIGEKSFRLAKRGNVFVDAKKESLGDLKVGDEVTVRYVEENGGNVARAVAKGEMPEPEKKIESPSKAKETEGGDAK